MGTYTSQILAGTSHNYHEGIMPEYVLFLSENSRPAWILKSLKDNTLEITWIPTLEHLLEDALLMIGIYVFKDRGLAEMMKGFIRLENHLELYQISPDNLEILYEKRREIDGNYNYKVIISIFKGSSLNNKKLDCLDKYVMDREICKSEGFFYSGR